MSTEFSLLKQLHNENEDNSQGSRAKLAQLKGIARDCIAAHNKLVSKLWSIEIQLTEVKDREEKSKLTQQSSDIRQTLHRVDSRSNIEQLFQKIKALEIEIEGSSKIGEELYVL